MCSYICVCCFAPRHRYIYSPVYTYIKRSCKSSNAKSSSFNEEKKDFVSGGEVTNESISLSLTLSLSLFFKRTVTFIVHICRHDTMATLGSARGCTNWYTPVDSEETCAEKDRGKREREKEEERKKERKKSFSFSEGKKENGGERFALHSRPSLWVEKRLLLRNVISMSSHNGADNGAV